MPRKRSTLPILLGIALAATQPTHSHLSAQMQPATYAFSVATIRPSKPGEQNSNFNISSDRVTTENLDIDSLLKFAYDLNRGSDDQIINAPAWLRTSSFDIDAKEDDATIAALSRMNEKDHQHALELMIRSLLADRFHLVIHHETRQLPVIDLLVAPSGPKLSPSANAPGWQGVHNDGEGHIQVRNMGVAALADVLGAQSEIGGRMVVDQTGLTGKYDFNLTWTPQQLAGSTDADTSGPSLFAALPEQLGLKLKSTKAPIDVIVIDHIDPPTPN